MQLDMNELILQAPLSLGAVCLPSGLGGCDIYPKKGVEIFNYGWVWEVWFAHFFGLRGMLVFFLLGEPDSVCETLHVQETKPREEPPVFEQSG